MNIYLSIICAINIYLSVAVPLNLKVKGNGDGASPDHITNPEKIVIHNSLLLEFKKNPTAFIAQMSKANPDTLREILGLLRGLLETSSDRETHLIDVLNAANGALDTANGDVTDSEGELEGANTWRNNAQNDVTEAESDLAAKEGVASQKQTEKDDAQNNHDGEIDTLNDEQAMLQQVIEILEDLLGRQGGGGGEEGALQCADGYRVGDWQTYLSSWGQWIEKSTGDDLGALTVCWDLAKANVQGAVGVYWDYDNGYCRAIDNKAPLVPFASTYGTNQGERSLCLLKSEV